MKKFIFFKMGEEILYESSIDLNLYQIDKFRESLARINKCHVDDICVERKIVYLSQLDLTEKGLFYWTDPEFNIISGAKLNLEYGSDEHLDAINNKTLENHLILI